MRIPKLNYPTLVTAVAAVMLLSAGGAYAANEWGSANIKNNSLTADDIKDNSLISADIKDNTLKSADVKDGTLKSLDILDGSIGAIDLALGSVTSAAVLDGTLTADDLGTNSVGAGEIQTDAVAATEIQDNSIDSGEIVDFGLTNQDVGVLFAQVGSDGAVDNSSGGVTGISLGTGVYEVDFGRNISACGFVVTQGEAGVGGAGGAITGATDRAGNAEAVFVTTRDAAGSLVNAAFQLVVVC